MMTMMLWAKIEQEEEVNVRRAKRVIEALEIAGRHKNLTKTANA